MEIKFSKNEIEFEKELNALDRFVMDFVSILGRHDVKYVLVSGYAPILFGRNRASEDVNIISKRMDFAKFGTLWNEIYKEFECLNTENLNDAYDEYLNTNVEVRFSKKGRFIPNIELKFPRVELDSWTLKERKRVLVNDRELFISPLELQIPFKLFLGSEKDIEDARYLYVLFKNDINLELLREFNRKLSVEEQFNKYLIN